MRNFKSHQLYACLKLLPLFASSSNKLFHNSKNNKWKCSDFPYTSFIPKYTNAEIYFRDQRLFPLPKDTFVFNSLKSFKFYYIVKQKSILIISLEQTNTPQPHTCLDRNIKFNSSEQKGESIKMTPLKKPSIQATFFFTHLEMDYKWDV